MNGPDLPAMAVRSEKGPGLLVAAAGDFVLLVSPRGEVMAASASVAEVFGWEIGPDHTVIALSDDTERAMLQQLLDQVLAHGSVRSTVQLRGRTGRLWLDIAARHLVGEPGDPVYICARDVSDDVHAAYQLEEAEHQWRVAFEHSPIGGALLDAAGAILVANDALARMLERPGQELTRLDISDILEPDAGASWELWWKELVVGGGSGASAERALLTSRGTHIWSRITGAVVASDLAGERVIIQFEDITGRREAEQELASRALHDSLTGSPNRFLTHQWLASALADQPGGQVGVLYCDLDRFKIVNDSLGHAAGDDLLAQVADRMRQTLRPQDLLGRVGGDEFVAVIEGVPHADALAEVAARLTRSLDVPLQLGAHRHTVTVSIGGSLGSDPDTADDVLIRADMALLRAKRQGRARYVAFDPAVDQTTTPADLQLEDDLRLALGRHQIAAFYQPIVELAGLTVTGQEALIRWQHPTLGLLLPDRFLELAETTSLIRPLGRWMLTQACGDAMGEFHGPALGAWVSVNVSPNQLTRPGFVDEVIETLALSGLRPERLHLELTETALISAGPALVRDLETLAQLGVRIGLDDFGTGFSSLSLLHDFPVHVVKIDRSFVDPMLTDTTARAIVKAVLSMCHDMGLPAVAEGVERPDQVAMLRDLGCSHAQGYLFGRPGALRPAAGAVVPPATAGESAA